MKQVNPNLIRIVGPLVLVAISASLLFVSADLMDRFSLLRASMGVAILFAVFVRQAGLLLDLVRVNTDRERQLSMITDVVTALSSPLEEALKPALSRIAAGLQAEVVVLCRRAGENGAPALFEHIGLPDAASAHALVEELGRDMIFASTGIRMHSQRLPGQPDSDPPAHCLTTRLGLRADDGYLLVARFDRPFGETEGTLLAAIASDVAGNLLLNKLAEALRRVDSDALTGLFNHRAGFERLQAEVAAHQETGKPLSVLLIDLDDFRLFNDAYGHAVGDAALKAIGAIIRDSLRDSDVVARYGGDELLVLLPGAGLEASVKCARRLQTKIAEVTGSKIGLQSVPIYVSCGVSNCPDDSTEALELVAIADSNLFQAKTRGSGQVCARTVSVDQADIQASENLDQLRSLVIAVDNKDRYTRRHSEEVTAYALSIARTMELDEPMMRDIYVSGMLHDLGKIGVPDRILRKPGKLAPDEVRAIQQHPVMGALIVGALLDNQRIVDGVRHHHERFDGKGYPDALAGDVIPFIARILAVADVFSALTTDRPYRRGMTSEEALEIIQLGAGTQFDPRVVTVFCRIQPDQPCKIEASPPAEPAAIHSNGHSAKVAAAAAGAHNVAGE